MKARILLIVALAMVLLMAGGVSAAPAAAGGAVVPFKARYETYPEATFVPGPPPMLMVDIPAEGQATHLGKSTWEATMLTYFDWTQEGTMVFTAANGDQLFGGFAGEWSGTPPIPPNPVTFWGTFWIDGGTGRFEGATATGEYWGTAEAGEGMLYFDGMLTK